MKPSSIQLLNPKNPRAGIINNEETYFGMAGLKFIALSRNILDDENIPINVKHCLKIQTVAKKEHNKYGAFSNLNESIFMELKLEHTQGIAGVLYGVNKEFKCEIVRPGVKKKSLHLRRHKNNQSDFSITLSYDGISHSTGFDSATAWLFLMVLMSVLKSIHPAINEQTLITTFVRVGGITT